MKKVITMFLCAAMFLSLFPYGASFADEITDSRVVLLHAVVLKEGERTAFVRNARTKLSDEPFFSEDGNVWLSLRAIAETLNLNIGIDEKSRTAYLDYREMTLSFTDGEALCYAGEYDYPLSDKSRFVNGNILLPLDAMISVFGKSVLYDEGRGLVIIAEKGETFSEQILDAAEKMLMPPVSEGETEFYVSANGNDGNPGTKAAPFKTLERARDAVRPLLKNMAADIIIYVREGQYFIEEPIVFSEKDSGQNGFNVVYRAYPGERPVIDGGREVKGWQLYKGHIYRAHIGGEATVLSLLENGKMMQQACYPNKGENKLEWYMRNDKYIMPRQVFKCKDEYSFPVFEDLDGLEAYFWGGGNIMWSTYILPVSYINYEAKSIYLSEEIENANYPFNADSHLRLQGRLELLDSPGEFAYDNKNDYLYFWPSDSSISGKKITYGVADRLIDIVGKNNKNPVHNIVFDGLTLQNTAREPKQTPEIRVCDMGDGIRIRDAENITVTNCTIRSVAGNAVFLWETVRNCAINRNDIYDFGNNGIYALSEIPHSGFTGANAGHSNPFYTSDMAIIFEGNSFSENHIYDGGLIRGDGIGVLINHTGSANNRISNNRIENLERIGILIQKAAGADIIEYNDIYDVMNGSEDGGPIYTVHTSYDDGTVIRNNWVHRCNAVLGGILTIYNDENSNGVRLIRNITDFSGSVDPVKVAFYGSLSKGVGIDIINNVYANSPTAKIALAMGQSFKLPNNAETTISRNIIYNYGNSIATFPTWKDGYIKEMDGNIYFDGKGSEPKIVLPAMTFSDWQKYDDGKYDQHSINNDPGFMNGGNGDYRLRYDSHAYRLGIQNITRSNIGLPADYPFADSDDRLYKLFAEQAGRYGSDSTINLAAGEKTSLTLTARTAHGFAADLSGAAVRYESDAPNIATVDKNGIIKGINPGVAKVTVSAVRDTYSVSCVMFVIVDDAPVDIALSETRTAFSSGETVNLYPYIQTKFGQVGIGALDGFSLTVEDESIVTVNRKGFMTVHKKGKTVITAVAKLNGKTVTRKFGVEVVDALMKKIDVTTDNIYSVGKNYTLAVDAFDMSGNPISLAGAQVNAKTDGNAILVLSANANGITFQALNIGSANLEIAVEKNGIVKFVNKRVFVGGENTLGTGWNLINFGTAAGYAGESDGKINISSTGKNIYGTSDDGTFAYRRQSEANYTVYGTIERLSDIGSRNTAAGLMIRSSEDAAADCVHLRLQGTDSMVMIYRNADNPGCNYISISGEFKTPVEVKLEKVGKTVSGYVKQNGEWLFGGKTDVNISGGGLAGLAIYSQVTDVYADADISGFRVEQ